MDIPQIDVAEAKKLFDDKSATFVDVRDPDSYFGGRIPGATWVHGQNVDTFQNEADKEHPHVIYCFHGNMSQGATEQFLEKGFKTVYSMAGGFGAWGTASYPTESGAPEAQVPEGFAVSELAKTKLNQYLEGEAPACPRFAKIGDGAQVGLHPVVGADLPLVVDGLYAALAVLGGERRGSPPTKVPLRLLRSATVSESP